MIIISKNAVNLKVRRLFREQGFLFYRSKNNGRPIIVTEIDGEVKAIEPVALLSLVQECYRKDAKENSLEAMIAKIFEEEPDTFKAYLETVLEPIDGTFLDNNASITHLSL